MPDPSLALSIPGLFLTCVQYFNLVQLGRNYEEDFASSHLQLRTFEVRFQRWGAAAGITDDNEQSMASMEQLAKVHNPADVKLAYFACVQIKTQLDRAREDSYVYSQTTGNPQELALANVLEQLDLCGPKAKQADGALRKIKSRYDRTMQKTTKVVTASKWALFKKNQLEGLLRAIGEHVTALETLFPQREQALAAQEAQALDPDALEALAPVSMESDPFLAEALRAEAPQKGHSWDDIVNEDETRTHMGHNYRNLAQGFVIEDSARWHKVKNRGKSDVHAGHNYDYATPSAFRSAGGRNAPPPPQPTCAHLDNDNFPFGHGRY